MCLRFEVGLLGVVFCNIKHPSKYKNAVTKKGALGETLSYTHPPKSPAVALAARKNVSCTDATVE